MQFVRTLLWALILFLLLAFSFFNWKAVDVQIWPNLILETRLPALVVVAFLLGFVPMWLVHRAHRWRTGRRMTALEAAAARMAAPTPPPGAVTAPATPRPDPAPASAAPRVSS